MHPPRALYCQFPLGRPLGKPGDPGFQRRVLRAALALLDRVDGPVLEDFPDRVEDDSAIPLACAVPPRHDPASPAAVDEARGLRAAYERQRKRSGRTNVGQVVDADGIPEVVAAFLRIAEGVPYKQAGLPGSPRRAALDVRAYFEEAALALAVHVPGARQAESWFFQQTEAGAVLKRAQSVLFEAGATDAPFVVPITQQDS